VSHQPSPKWIGGFVVGAFALSIVLVITLGSVDLFSRPTRYVLFFDQSVQGLTVGSPVKFRGVPIGAVEQILLRVDGQSPKSKAIPVIIRIDQRRVQERLGLDHGFLAPKNIGKAIDRGLCARLTLESFITGQLFVEFDYAPEREATRHLENDAQWREIPTHKSSIDQITRDLAELIKDAGEVDLARLNENVNRALKNLADVLGGLDSKAISGTVTEAARSVTRFVGSSDFRETVAAVRSGFEEVAATARRLQGEAGPLRARVSAFFERFETTLDNLDRLSANAASMVEPGSDFRYQVKTSLRELQRAAQSLRGLSDYLERNPGALLRGRADGAPAEGAASP